MLLKKETLQSFTRTGAPVEDSGKIIAVGHCLIPTAVGQIAPDEGNTAEIHQRRRTSRGKQYDNSGTTLHSLIPTAGGQIWLRMKETLQRFTRVGATAEDSGKIIAVA